MPLNTKCAICNQEIDFDHMYSYASNNPDGNTGMDYLKNNELTGHQENGRNYCAHCWALR